MDGLFCCWGSRRKYFLALGNAIQKVGRLAIGIGWLTRRFSLELALGLFGKLDSYDLAALSVLGRGPSVRRLVSNAAAFLPLSLLTPRPF